VLGPSRAQSLFHERDMMVELLKSKYLPVIYECVFFKTDWPIGSSSESTSGSSEAGASAGEDVTATDGEGNPFAARWAVKASREPPKNPATTCSIAFSLASAGLRLARYTYVRPTFLRVTTPFCAMRSRIVMMVVYARGRRDESASCTCLTVASSNGHNAFMQSNSKGARSSIERLRSPFGLPFDEAAITSLSFPREVPGATAPAAFPKVPRANNDPREEAGVREPRPARSNRDRRDPRKA